MAVYTNAALPILPASPYVRKEKAIGFFQKATRRICVASLWLTTNTSNVNTAEEFTVNNNAQPLSALVTS